MAGCRVPWRYDPPRAGAATMWLILIGLLIAAVVFLVTGGHLIFLPLFFVLPLGGLAWRRSGRRN